jgi:hypothetical protein
VIGARDCSVDGAPQPSRYRATPDCEPLGRAMSALLAGAMLVSYPFALLGLMFAMAWVEDAVAPPGGL